MHAATLPDEAAVLPLLRGRLPPRARYPSMRFARLGWLEDLVVTASRRSHGIGRALLDAATEWARARGATELELSSAASRRAAHRFYIANGMASSQKFTRPLRD